MADETSKPEPLTFDELEQEKLRQMGGAAKQYVRQNRQRTNSKTHGHVADLGRVIGVILGEVITLVGFAVTAILILAGVLILGAIAFALGGGPIGIVILVLLGILFALLQIVGLLKKLLVAIGGIELKSKT